MRFVLYLIKAGLLPVRFVVTSKSRESVDLAFGIVPPPVRFDTVVTFDDTERHKPEPEPILLALERLGVEPGRAAYVGDAPWDVQAARAAGCAAVAVSWGSATADRLREEAPDELVGTPSALAALLLGEASVRDGAT